MRQLDAGAIGDLADHSIVALDDDVVADVR